MRTVWWSRCENASAVTTRVLQHALARLEVVRVQVGQRLEQRQRHHQLADAADVLPVVGAVLGIARLGGIGQVEHGQAVVVHAAGEHAGDLRA